MKFNKLIKDTLNDIGCPVSFIENTQDKKPDIYVTFSNMPSTPVVFADDKENIREYNFQVDIWCKYGKSYASIMDIIIEKMQAAGFKYIDGPEMYEEETKIIHKVLQFTFEEEK